jgi:ATP-dependent Clp protease ATP-binding subunit ClpX
MVTQSGLRAVAQKALKRGTGTRGLRSIMEVLLTDVMYEVPETTGGAEGGGAGCKTVLLDEEGVVTGSGAKLILDEAEAREAVGEEDVFEPMAAVVQ